MASDTRTTGAPTRAPSNIVQHPNAAQEPPRRARLTRTELADRGVARLQLPGETEEARDCCAALIIAGALLAQLTPAQRRAAEDAVHLFYQQFGTDEARAAAAFVAGVR